MVLAPVAEDLGAADHFVVDIFRGHEHEGHIERLRRQHVPIGDLLDAPLDVRIELLHRRVARARFGLLQRAAEIVERKFAVDAQRSVGRADERVDTPAADRRLALVLLGRKQVPQHLLERELAEVAAQLR